MPKKPPPISQKRQSASVWGVVMPPGVTSGDAVGGLVAVVERGTARLGSSDQQRQHRPTAT